MVYPVADPGMAGIDVPADKPEHFTAVRANFNLPAVLNEKQCFVPGINEPYLRFFHIRASF
jgi:hypothetical protein